jgi:hypothetical protein
VPNNTTNTALTKNSLQIYAVFNYSQINIFFFTII